MGIKVKAQAQKLMLVYSIHDPAINQALSSIPKYVETHDVKYLHFEPIDEEAGDYPATEFWVKIPAWEDVEPIFWEVMGDPRKMAAEMFRIYVDDFKHFVIEDEEGKVIPLVCRKALDPDKGQAIVGPVLSYVPKQIQQDIGTAIMTLGGITEKSREVIAELQEEIGKQLRIVPKEHEKNSLALESSTGSTMSTSDASAVNNDHT